MHHFVAEFNATKDMLRQAYAQIAELTSKRKSRDLKPARVTSDEDSVTSSDSDDDDSNSDLWDKGKSMTIPGQHGSKIYLESVSAEVRVRTAIGLPVEPSNSQVKLLLGTQRRGMHCGNNRTMGALPMH